MTNIEPFGTSEDTPSPVNIGVQTFLGLTVVDVNCTSSWDSQGASCNIKLIQSEGEYLEEVVVGSPQYFEIVGEDQLPIFRFYGILIELARDVDSGSKYYNAVLNSPTILLEASAVITRSFAGYGGALEAAGANVSSCLDFGTRNNNINTSNIFNVLNVFGYYENDRYGVGWSGRDPGFGRSLVNDDGMRVDLFAAAVNDLLNGNPQVTPALGSNIIYGARSYNNSESYAYNFDILSFVSTLNSFIPALYRTQATTLMEFVDELCKACNFEYLIDLRKPNGAGNMAAFNAGHITSYTPIQTHSGTIYGGQVVVILQNKNISSATKFPLSAHIVGREISDKESGIGQVLDLPLDIGMRGTIHPDGPPVASDPLGGSFPVESLTPNDNQRYSQTNLQIRLNTSAVGARYITGGYQSRMHYISTYGPNINTTAELEGSTCAVVPPADTDFLPDVYQYWGEVTGVNGSIAVLTPILDDPVSRSLVVIPIEYQLAGLVSPFTNTNDVEFCSVSEIAAAGAGFSAWKQWIFKNNTEKAIRLFGITPWRSSFFEISRYISVTEDEANTFGSSLYQIVQLNIWRKIAYVAQNYYGKVLAVKVPSFSYQVSENIEEVVPQWISSWKLADSAYIDPSNYNRFETPPSNRFYDSGRIKAYANYINQNTPYHDPISSRAFFKPLTSAVYFNTPEEAARNIGLQSNTLEQGLDYISGGIFMWDNNDVFFNDQISDTALVTVPISINPEYLLVPTDYFRDFNISNPHIQNYANLKTMFTQYGGVGCIPFALITLNGRFNNEVDSDMSVYALARLIPPTGADGNRLDGAAAEVFFLKEEARITEAKKSLYHKSRGNPSPLPDEIPSSIIAIYPKSIAIPQQSNRYVYGPWVTNVTLPYGMKIEYEQVDSLVPEAFVLPSNADPNTVSGFDGMNTAGQLLADTVESFDYLFTESASVSIPDYPEITHLGQALIEGGPLVTDISISTTANGIVTDYNMTTFAPKFGRTNKNTVDIMSKLAKRLNNLRSYRIQ